MMLHQRPDLPVSLAGVEASRAFFQPCFTSGNADCVWVAHVDERARCIGLASHPVEEGSRALPISAIVQKAAQTGSAGLILAQRPEGSDGLPSNRQAQNTRALADAAELIDVVLLDHLLISESGCESMRRSGLL